MIIETVLTVAALSPVVLGIWAVRKYRAKKKKMWDEIREQRRNALASYQYIPRPRNFGYSAPERTRDRSDDSSSLVAGAALGYAIGSNSAYAQREYTSETFSGGGGSFGGGGASSSWSDSSCSSGSSGGGDSGSSCGGSD